ncbi:MAG: sodium-translocating pyrophosphatase [Candidatus Sericytochromatia bacterium]|nr:sodium-translocating pyrophosphatase [Candidatus Tanganyikabacteria bacterium]
MQVFTADIFTAFTWLAILSALAVLLFSGGLTSWVLRQPAGNARMQEIAGAIQEGARAYLNRQYGTIAVVAGILAFLIFWFFQEPGNAMRGAIPALGFLVGASFSGLAGYVGMNISVRANVRTAAAAEQGLAPALQLAFRGGAVTGFAIAGLGLLGVAIFFATLYLPYNPGDPHHKLFNLAIEGMGFGASLISLFARVGGGIFTKAADVGGDLVGKVEAGIPEDDPRNPATIADNVGDNVGDCAGMGADLFETYVVTMIAAMLLGQMAFPYDARMGVALPLGLGAAAIIASIVGQYFVRLGRSQSIMGALYKGLLATTVIAAGLFYWFNWMITGKIQFFWAATVGLAVMVLITVITEYYTSTSYRPVKQIAESSQTGPATNIISGLAVGMESTLAPVAVIVGGIACAYFITEPLAAIYYSELTGLTIPQNIASMLAAIKDPAKFADAAAILRMIEQSTQYGTQQLLMGAYGIAIAAVGMLSAAGMVVAIDSYGPITDNAGGIAEMSELPPNVRQITDALDAVGNTTKAVTKGYAIGSAGLGALALFITFTQKVSEVGHANKALQGITYSLQDPYVIMGLFLGAMIPFFASSLFMNAVGKAAQAVIVEVRRQFKEMPGIMDRTQKPDYGRAVDLVTRAAIREMLPPGIIAVAAPVICAFISVRLLGGMLAGAILAGMLLALMMATGGGAWDNGKKLIETGMYGGKGSEAHKAAVVGDTVGDPFKDTAGPALNPMIKILNIVALLAITAFGLHLRP